MKPVPWSHSHLESIKNCPHQYHEVKVVKRVKDNNYNNEWGDWVHKQIEAHYKAKEPPPWHENLLPYVPQIESAVAWAGEGPRWFELKMGLSKQLTAAKFFDNDVWGRAITDLLVVNLDTCEAFNIDWKTGRVKPDSRQLRLAALFIFYHFPRVVRVHNSYEWLQHNTQTRESIEVLQLQDLWREFLPDLTYFRDAFRNGDFPKRPSGLCNGWCPVESCEHWKPKR